MSVKVAVITGSRADYGLLVPLLTKLYQDEYFETYLLVTGMHLLEEFGYTKMQILKDGFAVYAEIDLKQKGDDPEDICEAVSNGLIGFSEHFKKHKYDVVFVLGDRYELWSVCMAAVFHRIPIAHIHGGETSEGALDEVIRHSITKMATFHFVSLFEYENRVKQMGENSKFIFNVGALGIDNITKLKKMPINELSAFTEMDFQNENIGLLTYHPVTTDDRIDAENQMLEIIHALIETDLKILLTAPNFDAGGKGVYRVILKYCREMPDKFVFIKSLGQKAYLSALQYSKLMIGNSSSGIIEAASFKLPVVNVGDRQSGRFRTRNIIDCNCCKDDIKRSIEKALSADFKESLSTLVSPYGDGTAAEKIIRELKKIDFNNEKRLIVKKFNDFHIS